LNDTQYELVSRAEAETSRYYQGGSYDGEAYYYGRDPYGARGYGYGYGQPGYYPPGGYVPPPGYVQPPRQSGVFGLFGNQPWYEQQQAAPRPRRVDPDYFFGRRQYY
jgi:hypothetical protein